MSDSCSRFFRHVKLITAQTITQQILVIFFSYFDKFRYFYRTETIVYCFFYVFSKNQYQNFHSKQNGMV